MQEVQFITYEGDGKPTEGGVATFDGEVVSFYGVDPALVESFNAIGVSIGPRTFYPKDGLEFLGVLRSAFSGSRFRATGIKEV